MNTTMRSSKSPSRHAARRVLVALLLVVSLLVGCDEFLSPLDSSQSRSVEVQQLLQYLTSTEPLIRYVRYEPYAFSTDVVFAEIERPSGSVLSMPDAFGLTWSDTGAGTGTYSGSGAPVQIDATYTADSYAFDYAYSAMPTDPLVLRPSGYHEYDDIFASYEVTGSLHLERTNITQHEFTYPSGSPGSVNTHDGR